MFLGDKANPALQKVQHRLLIRGVVHREVRLPTSANGSDCSLIDSFVLVKLLHWLEVHVHPLPKTFIVEVDGGLVLPPNELSILHELTDPCHKDPLVE